MLKRYFKMSIVPLELDRARDSIISLRAARDDPEEKRKREAAAPPDPYHLVHIVFFFLGMSTWMPMFFILTAQDYWMFKFRDTSQATYDLNNKTVLQQNFASMQSLINTIPALITNLLSSRYGHKIRMETRLVGTSLLLFTLFVVFTAFVKIDTDSWQLAFFVLTMLVVCLFTMNSSMMNISAFSLVSRFPQSYLRANQLGTNAIGVISALLQIISLSTNGSSTTVALIYFISGTVLVTINAVLMYFAFKLPRFKYFLGDATEDVNKPTQTISQLLRLAKKMWPLAFMAGTGILTFGLSGAAVTAMIVSEQYPNTLWSKKYFIPVVNFLLVNVVSLLATIVAGPYITRKNVKYVVIIDLCRQIFVGPLVLFCNLKTTHRHLPTLFTHDYQYIIIMLMFSFLMNFSMTCGLMSTPNLMPDDPEQGFIFMTAVTGTIMPLASPLATVWVNIM